MLLGEWYGVWGFCFKFWVLYMLYIVIINVNIIYIFIFIDYFRGGYVEIYILNGL